MSDVCSGLCHVLSCVVRVASFELFHLLVELFRLLVKLFCLSLYEMCLRTLACFI